jgi:tetratricopeptide (TPR) repeat protein/O-antigen ligase
MPFVESIPSSGGHSLDRVTARLCSRLLAFGLPYLYLMTSIAFYLHTYDSAQVKITLVQMGGIVLMGFWYVSLVCDFEKQWDEYAPVALPLIICLISGLVSFAHAAYRGPSLDECLRRVFYIHFALIALREFSTVERIRRLIFYLLIAVAVASMYGVVQFIDSSFFPAPQSGVDPFIWRQAFGPKPFSTFGNPNFFGNFLVILSPITLALMLKRNASRPLSVMLFGVTSLIVSAFLWHTTQVMTLIHLASWSSTVFILVIVGYAFLAVIRFSFLGLLFFMITLCTVVTESKGSWIGYTAGFVAFLMLVLYYFSQFQSDRMRIVIRRAAIGILLFATVSVGIYSRMRMSSIRFRVATWVSTWEMALMHPIWGNGIGSFRIIYPVVRRPQIFHIEAKHNTETDHSENEYWEVLQDEGIIGFGIFLWMIATFSALGLKALGRFTEGYSVRDPVSGKRKTIQDARAYYMLGVLAAFWGMLMHNFMDVSLRFVSSGIFLWLLAGLIGAMVVHDPMPETDAQAFDKADDHTERPHPQALLYAGQAICVGVFGYLTWMVLVQFTDTQGPFTGQFGEQLLWFIAWIAVLFTLVAYWYGLIRVLRSLKHVYGFLVLLAVTAWPLKIFWGYFMADVYHNRGIYFSKQGKWEDAIASYRKVVDLNPNYIMAYYFMGNVFTDRWGPGDVDRAMAEYEHVWAIAPNYVQSHHQAGLVYLKKGQDERRAYDQLHAEGKMAEADAALTQAETDWNQALVYFRKYHDIDPVFPANYARMGWVHIQLGEIAQLRGHPEETVKHQDAAEQAYKESLYAWVCRAPENDVLDEHWDGNHRHFDAEMFENLGNIRFMRGNLEGAARAYNLSLWQGPDNVRVLKNLASVFSRMGHQADAVRVWNRIRQLAPQDPDLQRVFHANVQTHP